MDGAFFMKVIHGMPMDEELGHSLVRSAQYTILCAQAPTPEKRIRLLVERLKATSETNAPQYTCFLLNSCIEALPLSKSSAPEALDPDFLEWMVKSVLNEAKKRVKSWPYFIQWVCALIHYLCTDDDETLCVFYDLGAPHVALAALQSFPNIHSVVLAGSTLLTHFTMFEVEGCVPALTNALHTYLEDIPVCLRTMEALAGFTGYDKAFPDRYVEACEGFVDSKGVEALTQVLQRHLLPPAQCNTGPLLSDDEEKSSQTGSNEGCTGSSSNSICSCCRFPEMLFYVACIAANVMNAGVLDDVLLSTTSPPLSTTNIITGASSTAVPTNFNSFSTTSEVAPITGSEGRSAAREATNAPGSADIEERRGDHVENRDEDLYQGDRYEDESFARKIISENSHVLPSGNEKTDPSSSKMIELLAAWLQPVHRVSDAYRIQVLQVLSNVPHSPFVDWECISTLFLSSQSESVVLWCLHFFSSVAMNVKETKWSIYRSGCVPRVLELMKMYPKNASIQEVACSLLSYLSFDSEVITECITKGEGIRLVLESIKNFSTHEPLLLAACAALSGLTFHNQAGQVEISEYKGIGLILDALRIGRKTRLLENGCLAIGTMCWNTELKNEVVQLGGIEVLMKILEEHYTHPGVVKNTFRALAQIAFNCEKYRMELSSNGIIPLIIRGMEQHPQHDKVQMQGCVALSYLSWTNQGNAAQITAHRGYQVVVEAMRNHPNHHEVQEHAARALANITQVSQEDALAALDQIVVSMRRHERCAEVQEETCRAIVTLSLISPANKDRLYDLGAAEAVIAAMRNFPRHQLVQQEACNALAHLAYEHASLNRVVTELHGIDLLLAAMRTHLDSPKVQLNACGGLSALAFDNPMAQRQIYELGGVQCVIRAMENFERLRMLELGCSALGTLAWNTEIKEDVAVEAVPEILKAMRVHEASPLLQKSTCRAISQFAFNSEKNRHLLAEAGAIPLVVRAMRNHLTTEKLIVHAVKALTYLCWENVQVAEQIINENIEEVLQQVVDHYAHSPRISGEAVHLSKILFRKTAGSLSPSIRLVSPPSSSPPLSMIPSTPYHGGPAAGRRILRRSGGGGGGGNWNSVGNPTIPTSGHPSHSPGGTTYPPPSRSPKGNNNVTEYSGGGSGGGEHKGGGGGGSPRGGMRSFHTGSGTGERDGTESSLLSSSFGREGEEVGGEGGGNGNGVGGGGKSTPNQTAHFTTSPFQRWSASTSRGSGGGRAGRRGGHPGTWTSSSLSSSSSSSSAAPAAAAAAAKDSAPSGLGGGERTERDGDSTCWQKGCIAGRRYGGGRGHAPSSTIALEGRVPSSSSSSSSFSPSASPPLSPVAVENADRAVGTTVGGDGGPTAGTHHQSASAKASQQTHRTTTTNTTAMIMTSSSPPSLPPHGASYPPKTRHLPSHADPQTLSSSQGSSSSTPLSSLATSAVNNNTAKVSRRGRRKGGGGGRGREGEVEEGEGKEEDLWDDPSPETFHGNREMGEENWRQCELERQSLAS